MRQPQVCLLSKQDEWSRHAGRIAQVAFPDLVWHCGERLSAFPLSGDARFDYLISFLSPWVVPANVLKRTSLAINFHPASSNYPGIGCYNFALYEDTREYGAVAHHMSNKVDTGALIEERLFPVFPADTVETLKLRTMAVMLALFHDIVCALANGRALPRTVTNWKRKPFTRKQLDALTVVTTDMDPSEVMRRIRATTYPGFPGAAVEVAGYRFAVSLPNREPFA